MSLQFCVAKNAVAVPFLNSERRYLPAYCSSVHTNPAFYCTVTTKFYKEQYRICTHAFAANISQLKRICILDVLKEDQTRN